MADWVFTLLALIGWLLFVVMALLLVAMVATDDSDGVGCGLIAAGGW
jgi:hypothetical protein